MQDCCFCYRDRTATDIFSRKKNEEAVKTLSKMGALTLLPSSATADVCEHANCFSAEFIISLLRRVR